VSGDNGSFSRTGLYVGADWLVLCHVYADKTPILDINAGGSSVSLSMRDRAADASTVEFARNLAAAAQKFAAAVERLHTAQLDGDDQAAGSDAA
jgi:hypothetical protein